MSYVWRVNKWSPLWRETQPADHSVESNSTCDSRVTQARRVREGNLEVTRVDINSVASWGN